MKTIKERQFVLQSWTYCVADRIKCKLRCFVTFVTRQVLMEGTPNYMHYAEVLQIFQGIEGVERVHNLRIWALSINKVALSAHLAIGKYQPGALAFRLGGLVAQPDRAKPNRIRPERSLGAVCADACVCPPSGGIVCVLLGMDGNYPNGFVVVLSVSRPSQPAPSPDHVHIHVHVHGQTVSN